MRAALVFAGVCLGVSTLIAADPSERELAVLLNSVERRVMAGDTEAMNDLTKLPGKMSVPAFLNFFKANYNIYGATAQNRNTGKKAALLATSAPGAEETLVKLLSAKPAGTPEWVFGQQNIALKCLVVANNKAAVRILGGALQYPELAPKVSAALGKMQLPEAPVSDQSNAAASEDAVEKWKVWWKAHADKYASKGDGN